MIGSRPPTLLTLIRHGETESNLAEVWAGSTDAALTARGRGQARALAAGIVARGARRPFAAVYCSDLSRARHTAAPLAKALGLAAVVEPALREYGLGPWEGRTFRDLHKSEQFYERISRDPDFAPAGGESPRAVTERFVGALRRIAAVHPGDRVLAVTHGGALSMGIGYLMWGEHASLRHLPGNCRVTELTVEPFELLSFDEDWAE